MTVRIKGTSRNTLCELAEREGASMQTILDIESYRRRHLLEEVNKAYATLRQDSKAWSEIIQERATWEATLDDGLKSARESAE